MKHIIKNKHTAFDKIKSFNLLEYQKDNHEQSHHEIKEGKY